MNAPKSAATEPVRVVLGQVEVEKFAQPIEGIGTARGLESVLVTSRVNGRVREVFFSEGGRVAKNERLVRLEDDEEQAELVTAEAAAEQARSRYRRMQLLAEKGLVPRDQAEEQAQIVASAESRLKLARVQLEQRTIRAPFAGVLGFKQVSPGTLVQPATAIVSLDAVETMRVEFSVPETLIGDLATGTPVEIRTAAYRDRVFAGEISVLGSRVDEVTRAIPVQALIPNPDHALKPGMLLTVTATAQPRQARFVPEAALAPENAEQFVWRVLPDNAVEKVKVTLGSRSGRRVEIASGLDAGDRIVVEGQTNLRPGRTVVAVQRAVAGG